MCEGKTLIFFVKFAEGKGSSGDTYHTTFLKAIQDCNPNWLCKPLKWAGVWATEDIMNKEII